MRGEEFLADMFKDYVDVIRCKDCKYFQAHKGRYQTWRIVSSDGVCKCHNYEMTKADDYCSRAERRQDHE